MSLKSIFLLVVGTLTVLAAIVTGVLATESWNRYERARRIVSQDALLADSAAGWARERGALFTSLGAQGPVTGGLTELAVALRTSSDESFLGAIASLEDSRPSLFMSALIDQAVAAHSRIGELRTQVDAAARLPPADRPAGLRQVWFAAMTDLIERSQLLRLVAGREAKEKGSALDDLQMLRQFAWSAAEHASRDRAMIGGLISSVSRIDSQRLEQLAANRGQVAQAWSMVRFYVGTSSATDELRQAVRDAADRYFRDFDISRRAMIEAGLAGVEYGVSAEDWFRISTEAIDSLLTVERVAGITAGQQVERAYGETVRATLLQGGLFLCGVALAAGLFLLMSRRVIEPIKRMTAATMRLARGDLDVPIPDMRGNDEIAGMASALRVFRENAVARAKLEIELRKARDEAQAANRTKSQFLANMSHELRTPLNAIIGFAELMQMEALGPLGRAEYQGYVRDIHGSGRHLLEIINNILDMSRIEVGQVRLDERAVAPSEITDACRPIIEKQAAAAGIKLSIEVEPGLPLIRVDPVKIRQILLNLMSNAVKFTATGGQVDCRVGRTTAGELVVEVADTGIGMTPEEIEIALEPFRQVDAVLSRRHEGTGLGLALARGLAELHDGRVELDSERGFGTRARLILPAGRFVGTAAAESPISNAAVA